MTDDKNEDSILGQIQPFELSDQEATNLSVAHDGIGFFIAYCTDRLWTERRKDAPDQAVLDHWTEESRKASQARKYLRSDDPEGVRAILDYYGGRLRAINQQRKAGQDDGGSTPR